MPEKLPNRQHDTSRKGPKRQRNSSLLFKGWTSPAPSNRRLQCFHVPEETFQLMAPESATAHGEDISVEG